MRSERLAHSVHSVAFEMETALSSRTPSARSATAKSIEVEGPSSAVRPALLDDPRSKRILAKTIYRELRESGVDERDVLTIATELIGLVTEELRGA